MKSWRASRGNPGIGGSYWSGPNVPGHMMVGFGRGAPPSLLLWPLPPGAAIALALVCLSSCVDGVFEVWRCCCMLQPEPNLYAWPVVGTDKYLSRALMSSTCIGLSHWGVMSVYKIGSWRSHIGLKRLCSERLRHGVVTSSWKAY
jgi:hypothetical protein